jgi:hypothetical protein
MKKDVQCSARIFGGSSYRGRPCSKPATVAGPDGRRWCATHDPEAKKRRAAAREAKWRAESVARANDWDRDTSIHEIAEAALAWRKTPGALDSHDKLKQLVMLADAHLKRWSNS